MLRSWTTFLFLALMMFSLNAQTTEGTGNLLDSLKALDGRLKEQEADLYYPQLYSEFQEGFRKLGERVANGEQVTDKDAQGGKDAGRDLSSRVRDELIWLNVLRNDITACMDKAEDMKAYEWAMDRLNDVNDYFFRGVDALANHDLDRAETHFITAKRTALSIIEGEGKLKGERVRTARDRALELMEETSRLTVSTETGKIIKPFAFQKEEFLKRAAEEIKTYPADLTEGDSMAQADIDKAWTAGTEAFKTGLWLESKEDEQKAYSAYGNAVRLFSFYREQAVFKFYTVKSLKGRAECLWDIAASPSVYGDPFLWPRIWYKNRHLIKDPSILRPGWVLVIPFK
jgi:nucleoid-associated protein YgaU